MSRSYRKQPIMGIAVCSSERNDKQLWHRRWRATERMAISKLTPELLDNHITSSRFEVSNVWAMGKDGHRYSSISSQQTVATSIANKKAKNQQEILTLKNRLLHKWMGK
ncbi:MAG: hypothetical protein V4495_26000 [Pseudomonadota bacterium]